MKFKVFAISVSSIILALVLTHDNFHRLVGWGDSDKFQTRMASLVHHKSENATPGSASFIGDSITQRMSTTFLGAPANNYGIGGLTTQELIQVIPLLVTLSDSGRIFLLIGINDFEFGQEAGIEKRLTTISSLLPEGVPLVWSGIQPVKGEADTNAKIAATNKHIESLCRDKANCTYVDTFSIFSGRPSYYDDHIHFSKQGYSKWQQALLEAAHQTP